MKAPLALALLAASPARADLLNDAALHAHVDAEVARGEVAEVGHLGLSLGALVPVLGSYRIDQAMFGELRPTAVVIDWILGGLLPLGLAIAALSVEDRRAMFGWTAVGLYAATRIGVLVVGNLHVTEYNRYLHVRLGAASSAAGPVPALVATWRF